MTIMAQMQFILTQKLTQKTNTKNSGTDRKTDQEIDFGETEKKLLELIREKPGITLDEMASLCDLSLSGV